MPFLTQDTSNDEVNDRKYVLWRGHIYFHDPFVDTGIVHAGLVGKMARELNISYNEIQQSENKPIVEAAGKIEVVDGKIVFGISSTSCKINSSNEQALRDVQEVAISILGRDRVRI